MLEHNDVKDLSTPCFVFEEDELVANFLDFEKALHAHWSADSRVAYSVKTNPLPWILDIARRCGCMAEVVSDEEYHLALSRGYSPEEIVFNGPIKGRAWIRYALAKGSIVNIDSENDIDHVIEFASGASAPVRVGIRVNIDLESTCPGETVTGDAGGRFGFSYEGGELLRVVERLKAAPHVFVDGLHMHVTTRSRSLNVYRVLAKAAADVVREFSLSPSFIDIGGGFFGGGKSNLGAYDNYARVIAEELRRSCDPRKTRVIVEPGGAVVCTPGYYIGRVLDVKTTPVDRFVVTDLSRINIDHEMKKTSYNHVLYAKADRVMPRQVLCGYTCMESDRLCVLENEVELQRGDIVVINFAGAYSMSFTPGMFIRYAPAVYAKNAGGMELVREPFSEYPPELV